MWCCGPVNLRCICSAHWTAAWVRSPSSRGWDAAEAGARQRRQSHPGSAWRRPRSRSPADIALFHQHFVLSGHKQHRASIVHATREFILSHIIMVHMVCVCLSVVSPSASALTSSCQFLPLKWSSTPLLWSHCADEWQSAGSHEIVWISFGFSRKNKARTQRLLCPSLFCVPVWSCFTAHCSSKRATLLLWFSTVKNPKWFDTVETNPWITRTGRSVFGSFSAYCLRDM